MEGIFGNLFTFLSEDADDDQNDEQEKNVEIKHDTNNDSKSGSTFFCSKCDYKTRFNSNLKVHNQRIHEKRIKFE